MVSTLYPLLSLHLLINRIIPSIVAFCSLDALGLCLVIGVMVDGVPGSPPI